VDHNDTIWLWNIHQAAHVQVEDALLLPRQQCAEFIIQDGNPASVMLAHNADRLRQSARLRDMMADFPNWSFGRHASSIPTSTTWTPYMVQHEPRRIGR